MELDKLQQKLIETARNQPVSDRVPYAFEQRIMARLREKAPVDFRALWAKALWRGAAVCVAVSLIAFAWSLSLDGDADPTLERTFLSMSGELAESW